MAGTRRVAAVVAVLLCAVSAQAQIVFELASDNIITPPVAVCVTGPFNKWSTTDNPMTLQGGVWRAVVNLPDGRHYYKFKLRDSAGEWHPMSDPANPFKALRANRDWCSFVDVAGGRRVEVLDGLETFRWPPGLPPTYHLDNGTTIRTETILPQFASMTWTMPVKPIPGAVFVKGDFGETIFSRFTLALCPDGTWRAHVPLRRPFSYMIYVDDKPHGDIGNDWEETLFRRNAPPQMRGRAPVPMGSRVPDGKGKSFSYRTQVNPTSPALAPVRSDFAAGDPSVLNEVTSHALSADYGRAVALAGKVREVNAAATGTSSPLAIEALAAEARAHKRWAKFPEAVRCWEAIMQLDRDCAATREAGKELSSYYLFIERNYGKTRALCERAMTFLSPGCPEYVDILSNHTLTQLWERKYDEVIHTVDVALPMLRPAAEKPMATGLADFLLIKAYAQTRKGDWDGARVTCEEVLAACPVSAQGTREMARIFADFARQRRVDRSRFLFDWEARP